MDCLKKIYNKYREIIVYVIAGGITSVVNWISYYLCYQVAGIDNVPSNIISWVIAVAVAFVLNKFWVFESKSWDISVVFPEMTKFVSARIISGALETFFMWLFVDVLHVNALIMKALVMVITIILNYIASKLFIFRSKE